MSPTVQATLQVIHAADPALQGKAFPLDGEVTVGRGEENTLVLSSDQASRRHAAFRPEAAGHLLVDLESTNGTLLNGKPVTEQTLRNGDVLRVGTTVLRYALEEGG